MTRAGSSAAISRDDDPCFDAGSLGYASPITDSGSLADAGPIADGSLRADPGALAGQTHLILSTLRLQLENFFQKADIQSRLITLGPHAALTRMTLEQGQC